MTWLEFKTVFFEEVRRGLSRTWWRIATLAIPGILLVAMIAAPIVRSIFFDDDETAGEARVGIVDPVSFLPLGDLNKAGIRTFATREDGVATLAEREISALFVIADDYMETGLVEWLHTTSGLTADLRDEDAADKVRQLLRRSVLADRLSPEIETRFLSPATFESTVVNEDGTTEEGAGEAAFLSVSYIFGFLLMFAIMTGGNFLMESVSDEKQNRMIEVLLTSVSPLGMMAGKVFGMGAITLAQLLVWGLSVSLIGPRVLSFLPELGELTVEPLMIVWMVAFFLAGYFVVSVVLAGIGAATNSSKESSQISAFVTIPVITPLILFQFIVGDPDGLAAVVMSYIPFTAPLTMMMRLGATDVATPEIVASLFATVLGGFVLLWASARVFRAGLLMYGQRMTLGGVVKALRQAA